MPQPVSYNPGTPVSGSIQENSISYVVDGQNRNYRGGFGGLSWMSEVPAANNVIFIGNSTSLGRGPANIPLFYPSYNNSAANIIYAANTLPGSPRNFTTTSSVYNWAATNNFFINNSDNPIPRIDADGLGLYLDASQPTSYPQTGTTWYDLSGVGTNGTLTNGATYVDEAIRFDGVDDQVSANNVSVSYLSSSTVDVIFKVGGYSGAGKFALAGYNFNGGGYSDSTTGIIYISDDGTIASSVITTSQVYVPVYSTTTVVLGRYYQATLYKDTVNGVLKLYVNGKLESTNNFDTTTYAQWPNPGTFIGNNNFAIGYYNSNNWGSGPYFSGSIANTKLYSKLLSDSEIQQNYFQGNIVTGSLVFMVDANNLISYPKSGTSTYSLTGSIIGTLTNGVGFNNNNGGTWTFDGVDDYITFPNDSSLNLTQTGGAVSAWFKTNVNAVGSINGNLVAKTNTYTDGYWLTKFNNKLRISLYGSGNLEMIGTKTITDDVWHYVVGTWTSNQLSLYVDGVLDTSQSYNFTFTTATNPLYIGRQNTAGEGYFKGNIADVQIYNKALTSDEVQQNYQATKDKFLGENIVTNGLVLNLDSANKDSYPGTGTTWYDLSGNGYNGTLINGPSFLSNQNGGIFDFDGVDDYTSLGSSAASLIQGKTAVTIGIFFKLDVLDTLRGLIGTLNYGCGANLGLVASGNALTFYNDTGTCYDVGISSFVETGKWIYAVGTYDGTTTRIYGIKDGTLSQSSGTSKSGATNTFTSDFIVIGNQYPYYFTNGQCGTAFVYNRVLSQAEILQNYNAQKTRFGL